MVSSKRRILVPLDGSPLSEGVLPIARLLARALPADLVLLGVGESPDIPGIDKVYLSLMVQQLVDDGFETFGHFRSGKPAAEILAFAATAQIDLIAMSTHGRSSLSRMFVGSVTEAVLRRADVPVVITRAGTRSETLRRIAVALDGSDRAEEILPEVVALARDLKASLDLVRVSEPVMVGGGAMGDVPMIFPAEDPAPYLKGVSERLAAQGVTARPVALEGRAATEILRHAAEASLDLLCLTSHGRTGLARVLFGSIAEEVVRNAPCPVMVRRMAATPAATAAASAPGAGTG